MYEWTSYSDGTCLQTPTGWWVVERSDDDDRDDYQIYFTRQTECPRDGIELDSIDEHSIEYHDTEIQAWDAVMEITHLERQTARPTEISRRLAAVLGDVERLIETYEATPNERVMHPVRDALRAAIRALGGEV